MIIYAPNVQFLQEQATDEIGKKEQYEECIEEHKMHFNYAEIALVNT